MKIRPVSRHGIGRQVSSVFPCPVHGVGIDPVWERRKPISRQRCTRRPTPIPPRDLQIQLQPLFHYVAHAVQLENQVMAMGPDLYF